MNEEILKNLESARELFEKGDFGKSETLYMQIKKKATMPEDKAIIWAELSWLYFQRKMYEKAIEAADNVIINNENYKAKERLFRVQGYAYLGLRKSSMAAQYLELLNLNWENYILKVMIMIKHYHCWRKLRTTLK